MTISSSLAASVAGLNANAQRLAGISDNIANSSTFGYKRVVTDFHSMVVGGRAGQQGTYTAGGVSTTTARRIEDRGMVQGTNNSMDITIGGRGFLPVTNRTAVGQPGVLPLALMTTGSFRPDAEGVLTNSSGQVLMGWGLNANGTLPAVARDTSASLEPIVVTKNQFAANPTTRITMGANLPSTDTNAGAAGAARDLSVEYFGNLGQAESLNVSFTPTIPAVGSSNTWTMTITDSASNGATVGEYEVTFNNGPTNGGTLATITETTGGAYDPATGKVTLTLGGGDIDLNIGLPGTPNGLTQLAASFAPTELTKNGSPVGNLVGVEIDPNGIVSAIFDTGFNRPIYQVPLIDVPNPNGLNAMSDQTYALSMESGPMFLWNAGDGPTGETQGYTLEASTTDVALELTNLIQTQRAYSSNAKVIQTVDEMMQETTNIKR